MSQNIEDEPIVSGFVDDWAAEFKGPEALVRGHEQAGRGAGQGGTAQAAAGRGRAERRLCGARL